MNLTIDHIKDNLKDDISIIEVANLLGILDKYNIKKTGNTYLGDCPTGHTSENHQCFGLNTEGNYYHCFHCNSAGDIISLVQLVQRIGYKQALLWIAKNFQPDVVQEVEHLTFERTKEEEESYRKHVCSMKYTGTASGYCTKNRVKMLYKHYLTEVILRLILNRPTGYIGLPKRRSKLCYPARNCRN